MLQTLRKWYRSSFRVFRIYDEIRGKHQQWALASWRAFDVYRCLSNLKPKTTNNSRRIVVTSPPARLPIVCHERRAIAAPCGGRPAGVGALSGRRVLCRRVVVGTCCRRAAAHRIARVDILPALDGVSRGHSRPAGQGSTGSVGARCRIKEPRQLSERKQQRSASVTTCPTTQFSCCSPLLYWRIFSRTLLLLTKKNPKRWSVKACSWTACEANRTEQNSSLVQFVCCKQTFNSINTLTVQPDCNFFSCNKLYHILTVLTSRKLVKEIGLDSINLTVIFNVWHWLHTSQ